MGELAHDGTAKKQKPLSLAPTRRLIGKKTQRLWGLQSVKTITQVKAPNPAHLGIAGVAIVVSIEQILLIDRNHYIGCFDYCICLFANSQLQLFG
jgi:hypothetical protein